jgi:hypothetical protein
LKRRLLVDPHLPKEEARSSNLVVDNPLSQNPGIDPKHDLVSSDDDMVKIYI